MMNTTAAIGIHTIKTAGKALDGGNRNANWDSRIFQCKKRRKLEVKKHIFQLVFALCFICAVFGGTCHFILSAEPTEETELSFKYYKNIPVKQGDTLDSIARIYADEGHYESTASYVREVRLMNHLEEEDKVYAGDYLIIPYYSNELK